MPNGEFHGGGDSGEAPRGLVEALRRLDASGGALPPAVDLEVLATARRRLEQRRRARYVGRGAGALASAAALGLAAWALWPTHRTVTPSLLAGDADGSGVVDMLDALIVANGVRDGSAARAWDINGDGAVTRADVDLVAMSAVRLGAGTVAP